MGVWGWDEIEESVTLFGYLTGNASLDSDDGDWNFDVWPGQRSWSLLTNPNGNTNNPPVIQCEVEVIPEIYGEEDPATASAPYLNRLKDRHAVVVGTWARDRSHAWSGESINEPGSAGDIGKTEIHPVAGVLIEHPPTANNRTRNVELFAFSDMGSHRQPTGVFEPLGALPPHPDEDRRVELDLFVAAGSKLAVTREEDRIRSREFQLASSGSIEVLNTKIQTGRASDGKGFYNGVLRLTPGYTLRSFLLNRGLDPKRGIRRPMTHAGVRSVRAFFAVARLDGHEGLYEPARCIGLLEELKRANENLAEINEQVAANLKDGVKPKDDPILQAEKEDAEKQLKPLREEWEALGCSDSDQGPGTV